MAFTIYKKILQKYHFEILNFAGQHLIKKYSKISENVDFST